MGLPRISPCGSRRKGDCPPAWLPPPATSRGDWQGPGAVVFVRNAIRKVGKPGKAPRNKDRKVYRKVKSYLEIGVSSNVLNLLEAKKIGSKFWRLIYSLRVHKTTRYVTRGFTHQDQPYIPRLEATCHGFISLAQPLVIWRTNQTW